MSLSREYSPSVGKRVESPVRSLEFKSEADAASIAAIIQFCMETGITFSILYDATEQSEVTIRVSSPHLDFSTLGGAQAFFDKVKVKSEQKQKITAAATAQAKRRRGRQDLVQTGILSPRQSQSLVVCDYGCVRV